MKKNIIKISIVFTMLTIIGKLIGFFKEVLISSNFGASYITDAYNIALTIPNILYMVCVSAIMIIFIPNFYEVEKENGLKEAYNFANKFMTILLFISTIFFIIGVIKTDNIVNIIAPNINEETKQLTIRLTKISLINLFIMVITSIFSSILRSKNKYIGAAIMPIFSNIPIIIYLIFFKNNNIVITTIVTTIGFLIQILVLIPEALKINYLFKINFKGYNERLIKMVKNIIPMFFGLAIAQIGIIIDKAIASGLQEGSITSINLASKILMLFTATIGTAITTIFSPILAKQAINKKKDEWLETIYNLCKVQIFILVPISIIIFVLNDNIVSLIYQRGNFTDKDAIMVSMALFGYIIQLPFIAIRDTIAQALYSMQNTKITTINGIIVIIVNVILSFTLSKKFGVMGITLATAISTILGVILLMNSLKRIEVEFRKKSIYLYLNKIGIISIITGISIKLIKNLILFSGSNIKIIMICGILSIFIFLILCCLFKVDEFKYILSFLERSKNDEKNKI